MGNMARFGVAARCLLLSFAAFLLASDCELMKAVPAGPRVAGVFLLLEEGKYSFNVTAGAAACLSLSVRIASRAQMQRAVQRGLQTCKYGWIAERIAVVPRLTSDQRCGQGKTGVVTWFAKADHKFGVFCFNASDFEETPNGSTAGPHSSTASPTRTSPPLRSATESPPSKKQRATEAPEQTSFSASTLLMQTTHSTSVSSTSPTLKPSSTRLPPSLSPLGNVLTALIILGVVALLLTAAGVLWCYKLNIFTFGSRVPQKDEVETEMWKHADGEVELQSPRGGGGGGGEEEEEGGEEEEGDRKYSSDVTPDFKTNPSE